MPCALCLVPCALCLVPCAYLIVSCLIHCPCKSLTYQRKLYSTLLIAVLCCWSVNAASADYYDSGRSGDSWEDAYIINSAEDLRTLRNRVNNRDEPSGKYYVLNADIDLTSEIDWIGLGENYPFTGHFDGQNHTVRMNSENNIAYAALFHSIASDVGTIAVKNLNLTGTIIADCAGTIVHYLNSGTVDNCTFNGTIATSSSGGSYGAGGIVAHLEGGTITNCRVNANITGNSYAGGIAGEVSSGTIEGCTVEDSTRLTAQQVGGIAGYINSDSGVNISSTSNKWPSIYPLSGNDYTPTPPVPEEFTEWNNHRYRLITESLTWEEARARCEALGGHLATITTRAEQDVITSLLASYDGSYWLGANSDSSGWWHWVTTEAFERQYQNYSDGQPDGSGGFLVVHSDGKWDDVRGEESVTGFICEWDNEPQEVRAAPVAPSFAEWMANPALREDSDGAAPSPIDRSHLRNNPPRVAARSLLRAAAEETLPVSYDARTAIGLPEARDQGGYKTCWAFASIGAMEANYRRQKLASLGEYPDLSELHLAWFTYKTVHSKDVKPSESILNQAGDPDKAANFLKTFTPAPVSEDDMPYTAAGQVEAFLAGKTFTKAPISLTRTIIVGQISDDANAIPYVKSLIRDYGAVYFQYYHNENAYDETHHSHYSTAIRGVEPHAALLVGWDDDYPAENFINTPARNGAWLVRNSWGADWGDGGYFWMSYEQGTQSNMDHLYVFIVSEDVRDNTEEQKKHDEGGETRNIAPAWSANIFQARRDERIIYVTLNTTDNNAEYLLFVNNLGKNKPTNPGSVITEPVLSGLIPHAGFHTLNLPAPIDVYSGDYYSVIVRMKTLYEYPTAAEGTVDGYFTASVNEGESYFASGDEVPSVWVDGKNVSGDSFNATVRVVTVARPSEVVKPTITTQSLPVGNAGEAYTFRLEAQGTGIIEWRAGELPRGFSLSREGVLSGESDSAVEEDVRFTAFNAAGSDEAVLRLSVRGGVIPEPEPVGSSSGGGCSAGLSISSLGLVIVFMLRRRW